MAEISLNEKMVTVMNPMPFDTESELYTRAGIFKPNAGDQFAFTMEYQHSAGPEAELIFLQPGQSRALPASIARDVMTHLQQRGVAIFSDEKEKPMAMLTALRAAQQTYHSAGSEAIAKLYGRHGFRTEDDQTVKFRWPSYYINIEKEKAIRKEIERLDGQFSAEIAQQKHDVQQKQAAHKPAA